MKSKQSVRAEQLSQGSQVCSNIQARTYIEQKIREGGEGATSIILIQCDTYNIHDNEMVFTPSNIKI